MVRAISDTEGVGSGDPAWRRWLVDGGRAFLLSQQSYALALIDATLRHRGRHAPEYWYPDYFCGDALRVLRHTLAARGGAIRFYPVADDMAPDWEACEEMARLRPPDLFTLAHFFGVEGQGAAARAFADRHGALLHEDVALAFLPYGSVGRFGDFATYSPRKFVNLPDGGLLTVRGEKLTASTTIAAAGLPPGRNSALAWRWRQMRQAFAGNRTAATLGPASLDLDPANRPPFRSAWMSSATRRGFRYAAKSGIIESFAAHARATRANTIDEMARTLALAPLPAHPDAVPRWAGFRAGDQTATLNAINAMRAKGIAAYTWPGLPAEVKAEPERYRFAHRIRRTLLRVPFGSLMRLT